jgi:MFS family permease
LEHLDSQLDNAAMTGAVTRRWWALGAMVLAVLTVTLDVTVLTVALPTLAGTLKASESQLQWFVTSYTLALVAGMLPAGLIGDRYGRKRLLVGSLGLFTAGSLGCAYAPSPDVFIAARVVLGLVQRSTNRLTIRRGARMMAAWPIVPLPPSLSTTTAGRR